MARSNYSAGKRQRERDKERKKKAKADRARDRQGGSAHIPIASVDDIQGGMMSVDEVMRTMSGEPEDAADVQRKQVPSRLFVGGLSWTTTEADLQKRVETYGPVTDIHIVTDRDTGDSRGFGFVTMADRKDAAQVIKDLHGQELDGRTLVVRLANERR